MCTFLLQIILTQLLRLLHYLPTTIVNDRDATLTYVIWSELFKLQGVELAISKAYHPNFNGQTEIVNKSLEQYLRAFARDKPHRWVEWLLFDEFWLNTNFLTAIKVTPFEALYGHSPQKLHNSILGTTWVEVVDSLLSQRRTFGFP